MRRVAGMVGVAVMALALVVVAERPARADLVAAYVEGHGGISSSEGDSGLDTGGAGTSPALGFQIGARLLLFEAYFDHTAFSDGAVSRGIFGLRVGLGLGSYRLSVRGGVGGMNEQGGALTGDRRALGSRQGVVARAGILIEKRLKPQVFLIGLGLDGEVFSLEAPSGAITGQTQGSDIFTSLQARFELGI